MRPCPFINLICFSIYARNEARAKGWTTDKMDAQIIQWAIQARII